MSKKKLDTRKASVRRKFVLSDVPMVEPLATIYGAHYDRLVAVVDAARSGNANLIRLALDEFDRLGSASTKG
jgi:ribosomal protein S19E (S16A)